MTDYPIQDYGLTGNCETAALINPDGGIDWLCLPAFDRGSFFGALLDRENGGSLAMQPAESFTSRRRYLDDTAILKTHFTTANGSVALTDFFVVARDPKARFYDFTSLHPARKLVRIVRHESGSAMPMRLTIRARPDYARRQPAWRRIAGGHEMFETALFSSLSLGESGNDLIAEFSLEPGARHFLVLDFSDAREAPTFAAIDRWQQITEAFWREWNLFNYYRGPHRAIVRRSAVTLKLLTYAPTGAFVAAPTTSLPEVPGGAANWDYRYTWLRDTGLFIDTLFRLGYSGEAKAFLQFVVRQAQASEDGNSLGVLYAIDSGEVPAQAELPHLRGYLESRPVRTGNRARDQLQLDTSAHILEALFYFQHTGGKIDEPMQKLIDASIETLKKRWADPENGLWESIERRRYTYGKVMAWAGLTTAARLVPGRAEELRKICATIRAEVLAAGVHKRDDALVLAATFENDELDAASLLAFTSDFLPDDLARATREKIEEVLGPGELIFRNETLRAQGEGAFVLCSFWLVNHLIKEGEISRAQQLLGALLRRASPLGLFAEEIDAASGNFLGNFPQAFSHLGLIGTILNLDLAQRRPKSARWSDHERFEKTVGPTVGWRGVLAGFWRVPQTLRLLFVSRSKWRA